ncbi:MAG TPA: fimbria/pilus periplasmic chaperone [Candidatus Methanoperedens sp.]|nr:fimbria/pilus periplasmic chaperone [Candidatus Methanoperedens sp.]
MHSIPIDREATAARLRRRCRTTGRARFTALLVLLLLVCSSSARAGAFRVSPIRIDLVGGARGGGVVNVINEGQEPISFQIKAMAWSQDPAGKDIYTDTSDLVFFPQLMTTAAGETKVVRVGTKAPPPPREKSYRLFIEEIPQRKENEGAVVRIAIRFGVPVFHLPAVVKKEGLLEEARVQRGSFSWRIRNTGNVHLQVHEVELAAKDESGAEVFRDKPSGWYILVGGTREQSFVIPPEVCGRIRALSVTARAEEVTLSRELAAAEGWCP